MKRTILSSIFLLLLGTAIWWMSSEVVWLGDDLDYKYMMKGEIWQSWGRIKTFRQFFESQWIHYQHVNGRYMAHAFVQFFNARLGQQWFAISNAIVYVLFALLLGKAGDVRLKDNPGGVLSAICLSVLCFVTKMMPTCQIGYIWGMLVNIAWLIVFFREGKHSCAVTILMILTGIPIGNWQESISIGVCAGTGIWWIVQLTESLRFKDCRFDWRRNWMLLAYVAGTASNCLAPSTMGRVGNLSIEPIDRLLITAYSVPAIILLLLTILILRHKRRHLRLFSFDFAETAIRKGVLTCGMLFLLAFNLMIGVYSNRQLFGANLFAAILTLQILPKHRFATSVNAILSAAVIVTWCIMAKGITEVRQQYSEIARLHSVATDGIVYVDRTRYTPFGYPLSAKYYEDIVGQFDNDIHHSLMKDFKHVRLGRTLKIRPTADLGYEHIDQYAPGHFAVIVKEPPREEAPREITIHGHYPLGMKANPRKIAITKYFKRGNGHAAAVIIPDFPFFITDSISILTSP